MEAKLLTREQRQGIYEEHLSKDFHRDEVKPDAAIEQLIRDGKYLCYGFFEDNQVQGYAYLIKGEEGKAILLDYLVVFEENRSKGYGSEFLSIIKKILKGQYLYLLAEVENPDFAEQQEEKRIRERRIAFYKRNQLEVTGIKSKVITDNYNIMLLTIEERPLEKDAFLSLKQLYLTTFGEEFVHKNIVVGCE